MHGRAHRAVVDRLRGWELWSTPRQVIGFVLGIESIAVLFIVMGALHPAVTRTDWIRFAVLAACAVVHIDFSRGVDKARQLSSGAAPWLDTKTVWSFAAVMIFPVTLACAMVVLTQIWARVRVWRGRRPLYRWVFTTASIVLGTQLAAVVLAAGPGAHPGLPTTPVALAVVLAAAVLRWFTNYSLVVAAILISSPNARAAKVFQDNLGERIIEAGSVGLGIAAAGIVVYNPILIIGIVLGLIAMHRAILLPQYRKAASTDPKTGLHTGAWWREIAARALDKAMAAGSTLSVLMLDLDYLKQVNDKHGHLAGDTVLQKVARAVSDEIGGGIEFGRWGGDEFVAFVPDASPDTVVAVAERLRRRINALLIDVVTQRRPGDRVRPDRLDWHRGVSELRRPEHRRFAPCSGRSPLPGQDTGP